MLQKEQKQSQLLLLQQQTGWSARQGRHIGTLPFEVLVAAAAAAAILAARVAAATAAATAHFCHECSGSSCCLCALSAAFQVAAAAAAAAVAAADAAGTPLAAFVCILQNARGATDAAAAVFVCVDVAAICVPLV